MANNYVQVPPNSTGLKMQTFENTVSAQIVESEAVTLVRSSDNTEVGTSGQPLRVDPTGTTVQPVNTISNDLIDTNNSSTSTLGANSVFTGTGTVTTGYAQLAVAVDTDQVSASNAGSTGLVVQWSEDNSNWGDFDWATIGSSDIGGIGQTLSYGVKRKYYRVVYTNGATP